MIAKQQLSVDYPENPFFSTCVAEVYVGLTDEEALRLSQRHNEISHFTHKVTHRDLVSNCISSHLHNRSNICIKNRSFTSQQHVHMLRCHKAKPASIFPNIDQVVLVIKPTGVEKLLKCFQPVATKKFKKCFVEWSFLPTD